MTCPRGCLYVALFMSAAHHSDMHVRGAILLRKEMQTFSVNIDLLVNDGRCRCAPDEAGPLRAAGPRGRGGGYSPPTSAF